MYKVTMTAEQVATYETPFKALEALREQLKDKIEAENKNPLHYITRTWSEYSEDNNNKGLRMTATYSEERKNHFDANPL